MRIKKEVLATLHGFTVERWHHAWGPAEHIFPSKPVFLKHWNAMTKAQRGTYLRARRKVSSIMWQRELNARRKHRIDRLRTDAGWCEHIAEVARRNFETAALHWHDQQRHVEIDRLAALDLKLREQQYREGGTLILGDYGFACKLEK